MSIGVKRNQYGGGGANGEYEYELTVTTTNATLKKDGTTLVVLSKTAAAYDDTLVKLWYSSAANDFYLSARYAITVDGVNYAQGTTLVGLRADTTRVWNALIKAQ